MLPFYRHIASGDSRLDPAGACCMQYAVVSKKLDEQGEDLVVLLFTSWTLTLADTSQHFP